MSDRERLMNGLKKAKNKCLIYEGGGCLACTYRGQADCTLENIADYLLANGVTVQEWISVKDRLPIDDAILILKEEHKQRVDGYTAHLAHGGKGDSAEEVHLDALEMAIAALEQQKRLMPQPPKGE